jgi:heptosyltransferase III
VTLLKPLEVAAKLLLAVVAAILLWRPGRRARARQLLANARRVLVVRIDNRVGEALLTTPVFAALKSKPNPPQVFALVHSKVARVLEGHPHLDGVIPFNRSALALGMFAPGISALRQEGFDVVVNCSTWSEPSVTAALVSRLIAPRAALVGPSVFPSGWVADVAVAPKAGTRSEAEQRLNIASPLQLPPAPARLSFRTPRSTPAVDAFLAGLKQPFAVVNPGGRLDFRRVPPACFAAAAKILLEAGVQPVVTWGPGEEAMAAEVLSGAPGAVLAPPTNLDELAALMKAAKLTVCNNTGPMHLSVAVGTPTLALFLKMEVARWSHAYAPHRLVDLTATAANPEAMAALAAGTTSKMVLGLPSRA